MDIIPLGLLLLGVISLLIGWRWQNPRNEENRIALKGLAYLRNEIFRVQEQVHNLENEIQKTKQTNKEETTIEETQKVLDHKDLDIKENGQKEAVPNKMAYQGETKILESGQIISQELVHERIEPKEIEHVQSAKLYSITPQEQKETRDIVRVKVFSERLKTMSQAANSAPRTERISSKFTEILELAAQGQPIPEIAQQLIISQDAVRMVLSMQSKGGTR